MLLLDKVKSLELDLSVARSASFKLDQLLSVQKSHSDKSGIGFVESISVSTPHSTHFVPSSSSEPSVSEVVSETVKPPVSEVVKPIEVSSSRKIRVDLKLDLSIARSASSKLDQLLSVQKSPSDKSDIGFVKASLCLLPITHTLFLHLLLNLL